MVEARGILLLDQATVEQVYSDKNRERIISGKCVAWYHDYDGEGVEKTSGKMRSARERERESGSRNKQL